jgi:glycosyltransferase involved in cell wall biosynthesis
MKVIVKKYIVTHIANNETLTFDFEKHAHDFILSKEVGEKYFIMPTYEAVDSDMLNFRLTICMPIYLKPERTRRMIECLMAQTENGWEAYLVGDGCPHFAKLIKSGYFEALEIQAQEKGNLLHVMNLESNHGGYGAYIRNMVRDKARGKYIIFLDNDDVIKNTHVNNYLKGIEGTEYDFVAYESFIAPIAWHRDTTIQEGKIGFSELIIKTDYLRTMPDIRPQYSHDWLLVNDMVQAGAKYDILRNRDKTYIGKSLPDPRFTEKGID